MQHQRPLLSISDDELLRGLAAPPPWPEQTGLKPSELRPDGVASKTAVQPLAPARYKVQFTASAELQDKLERLQALMRSEVPDGDLAQIIERAVTEKLERLEAKRYAKTSAPRKGLAESDASPTSRHIPAAVRRAVHERDGNRCRYVDVQGRQCSGTTHLEFHHLYPFGLGGDHSPKNIRLMCRAHNQYLAECDFGKHVMVSHRRSGKAARTTLRAPSGPSSSD
jgi:hypothetical protein